MSFPEFFINRPVATSLLALAIALFGGAAFFFIPVAPLPQIEFPTITVQAALPGASPETMATSVATPLEKQLGQIAGVTEITSSSQIGTMRITIQFDLSRDINGAARDVQAAIISARTNLPPDLPTQPTYKIINPADYPIMIIGMTSQTYSRGDMYDIASSILQQKFSQIKGIGQVIVGGGSLPAVRVELNPDALNAYNISILDVAKVITLNNVNQPKGFLHADKRFLNITANDQLFKAKSYEPLIVSYKNKSPVRLKDIGEVIDSVEDIRNIGGVDGKPGIVIILYKEPGTNVIETVERVKATLDQLKASIPASIDLTVTLDRTTTIRASLEHAESTLIIAIILVLSVIYVFLANARAALIASIIVPLTMAGTFGVMYLCDFTLDNLSLMALTISTGFIVDDAVVVLENIERHIEQGMSSFKAAILGTNEVTFTVLSMSFSLVVIFMPILLMEGIVGRLFREFAITMSTAIMVSLLISLTITPMLASKFLLAVRGHRTNLRQKFVEWVLSFYRKTLSWALRRQRLILLITFCTFVGNIFLFVFIHKGFFPLQDTGRFFCPIQAQQNMSFAEVEKKFFILMDILKNDPAVEHVAGFAGGANAVGTTGILFATLKPLEKRKVSVFDVINRLRSQVEKVTGMVLYMQPAQDLIIGGRSASALFQYTLSAYDLKTLDKWVPKIQNIMSKIPGIVDLNSDQKNNGYQVFLTYNREAISRFGLTADQVSSVLHTAFGQRQVATVYKDINQYHVVLEIAPQYWQHPDSLRKIYLINAQNQRIPLSVVSSYISSTTLLQVNHQGQFPAATLSFNLEKGYSLGEIVEEIEKAVGELKIPSTALHGTFQGTAEAFQKSIENQPYLILGAILVVYILLGILYESTIHPITIISTLPSAGIGGLLGLLVMGMDLSVIGLIGMLLLIGIVKKNAIMMIDFALDIKSKKKKGSLYAIYKASLLRFRPIMMTTFSALFGAFPLAFESGLGSELRSSLGILIIGGLIFSQILTLYTTPVVYLYLERVSEFLKHFWQRRRLTPKNEGGLVS